MDLASELAPFSPSPELLFWAENRVGGLLEQVKTNATEIHWRDAKIEKLTLELAYLRRMKFGVKSESLAAGARDLFDETLAADLAACEARLDEQRQAAEMGPHLPPAEKPKRERAGRQPLPEQLPRVEHLHEPETCTCGQCGQALVRIGEDVTEKLSIVPAEFFVERHIYPKYACRPCETLTAAPAVASIIDGGLAAPALLAWVMVSKYADHRVLRTRPPLLRWKRCFTKDEGRPLEVGLQEQASNRHKLRELRVPVVSVAGKGGARLRQVRVKETNASEPLMTCRNVYNRRRNREGVIGPGQGWGKPDYCPTGVRHEGGVTLIQALVRNVGTCRPDVKGEAPADSLRKGQSTDAGHRDGVVRSRDEGPVMGLDRRGDVVQLCYVGNPTGEDLRG
ncbi:MAG: IS66 family transposase zinc-finger binding domain-containing protein [Candidatus Accumulibacter sp.]|uniref:IS66 family transposase zinc-finger binding domain-containing protein n=1 Tax=Candidatus Accumulibacter proximus TaxID=2954385 RepID=A0A935Q2Z0_9PROT|nr:IS66 family transposase zinc-finger binding domain-containing protein [Candidatus Accumulibacter proximus]